MTIVFFFFSKIEEQSDLITKLKKELEDLRSQNEHLKSQKLNDCKFTRRLHSSLDTKSKQIVKIDVFTD